MSDPKHLLLLYDRPLEPCFVGKGDKNSVFDLPSNYLPDRYKPIGTEVTNRFGEDAGERIPVTDIPPPDLGEILELARDDNFTLFLPKHRKIAGRLINIFLGMKNIDELQSAALYTRERVNPYLFNYALSVALLHRPDTQNLDLPTLVQSFPEKFVDSQIYAKTREESFIVPENQRVPVEIPLDYTASDLEEEHRCAYWREDIGINNHHWHWHLVYPFDAAREIVAKNRRGELFYYMHQQIIGRYNFERLSNQLKRVLPWKNWNEPIPEAYFPKLDSLISSRAWPARVANLVPQNINREQDQIRVDLNQMRRWRDRFYEAVHSGYITDDRGNQIVLTEFEGVDVLGDILEASILSPNRNYYGDLHNMMHVVLGYIHDPDHRHLEPLGVMADQATDMRDPMFYRLHAEVDDMFQEYKATLPRYTVDQLNFDGVTVSGCKVQSQSGPVNELRTFWQQSDIDLSRGMDFQPRGPVLVRFTHLQHLPFTYTFDVNNSGPQRRGTCRIFLAPKFDERRNPWLFRDQKNMFIELDRYTVNLRQGQNTITRKSTDSTITIPYERTFRNLDVNRPPTGQALQDFNFCGCGWPQHMLIPKGNAEGMPCHLFVMISDYAVDGINQDESGACNDAAIFCGIKDKLYPDRRSMGFPFDRMPRAGVNTLQEFLTPNMRAQEVTIRFENRTFRPRARN